MSYTSSFAAALMAVATFFVAGQAARAQEPPKPAAKVPQGGATAEQAIRKALGEKTDLELIDVRLEDLATIIEDKHKIQVELDAKNLDAAGVNKDTPFTRNLKGISLQSALRLILRDADLTYLIENEVLVITSREAAASRLTTRVYPIGDLVRFQNADGEEQNEPESLVELVSTTVAPASWSTSGGPGSLRVYRGALVVSASFDVHEELESLLLALRNAAPAEPAPQS